MNARDLGLVKIAGSFLLIGVFLFFHVWWPIQAERSLKELRKAEAELAQEKAELNQLQSRYAALTSLATLDAWARQHGPWKAPTADDILTIER
jgi:hypothetical protein